MAQLEASKAQIEGEEMYSDGTKTYVISQEKMARVGSKKPTDEKDLLAFFKTHADTVLDEAKDVPVVKADLASATGEK
jgi:hypothetical protein